MIRKNNKNDTPISTKSSVEDLECNVIDHTHTSASNINTSNNTTEEYHPQKDIAIGMNDPNLESRVYNVFQENYAKYKNTSHQERTRTKYLTSNWTPVS